MTTPPPQHHHLRSTPQTVRWGRLTPHGPAALRIRSGDHVTVDTLNPVGVPLEAPEAFFEQHGLARVDAASDILAIMGQCAKGPGPHMLTGPIDIADAEPGDTLEVQIEAIAIREPAYGVSFSRPGAGSLPHLLDSPWLRVMPIDVERGTARFDADLDIPLAPFMGTMGVAPTEEVSSIPPGPFGGNIDLKDLRPGTRLYLPVQVEGARFFVGDGHAVQGNGEVNLTGLETSLQGEFRFILHKACPLSAPVAETLRHYLPLGLHEDLDQATTQAVERTVQILCYKRHCSPAEAYSLASLLVDFDITQIVDGVKGAHARIPKGLLSPAGAHETWWWGPQPAVVR